jgi:hypothetical protein
LPFVRLRRTPPEPPSTAASALRPLLYGDVPIGEWPPPGTPETTEPWLSFVRARDAFARGQSDEAARLWLAIARTPGLESRQTLQAWAMLRGVGVSPEDSEASVVHGVVCEIPVATGHDVLAVYRDGSARYVNYSGKVAVLEPPSSPALHAAAVAVIVAAGPLGAVVGLWDGDELPAIPSGHARLVLLTPGGFRFGQGSPAALWNDPSGGTVLTRATQLVMLLTTS